jgi:hypothetical protein
MMIFEGEFMANLNGFESIVKELRAERTNLANQLRQVDAALSALGNLNGGHHAEMPRRIVSAAARRKMSAAQKARWANHNNAHAAATTRPKRTMSAAARRKIAAFQRARWAKVRAQQKKAA